MKKLEKLYKRTELEQIQEWTMCVDGNKYWSVEGLQNGTLTTNKPTVAKALNVGKKNETTPEEQALKEAQAKWKKKTEKGYSTDVKKIDKESVYFEPMLCHKYEDYRDRVDFSKPVYVQPKLDGQRCIARADGLWSRNGKPILSVPHIYKALKPLFDKNPNLIFDGELYADKFAQDFNQIMHLVRQQKPTEQDLKDSEESIQYWIYDFPFNQGTFSQRFRELDLILDKSIRCNKSIVVVNTFLVKTQEEMDRYYNTWMQEGYEGQIVRLDTTYENKRSRNILKRKEWQTDEFEIISVEEGEGNRAGMAGAMWVKLPKGGECKTNIKTNHTELEKIWKNKKKYPGKTVTVKYFGYTPDGALRFAHVIDIAREDFE